VSDDPPDYWLTLFEADDLGARLAVLRNLARVAAGKDPAALRLLVEMLPLIDRLLTEVQAALGRRN
jgi:hypothetical protein